MTKPTPALSVAVVERTAFIKIPGRANFTSSHDLKALVTELRQRGFNQFVLDLHECITMDSTFLGVLAGMVLRNNGAAQDGLVIELLNPNPRVTDLLENLGVLEMFEVKNQTVPCTLVFEPTTEQAAPTKEEVTRNCLQAHQTLMAINPENIPKFKEVAAFMAEDLKRMSENKDGNGSAS